MAEIVERCSCGAVFAMSGTSYMLDLAATNWRKGHVHAAAPIQVGDAPEEAQGDDSSEEATDG